MEDRRWENLPGLHSHALAGVGMEANAEHRVESSYSGADYVALGFVAPEVDEKGRVSKPQAPPSILLHHDTCHYQRKDSPVEALILSPEPLGCEGKAKGSGEEKIEFGLVKQKKGTGISRLLCVRRQEEWFQTCT